MFGSPLSMHVEKVTQRIRKERKEPLRTLRFLSALCDTILYKIVLPGGN
jgi:hypothetical protein